MKIIGYLRTSSTNKGDHEDSIAEQRHKILTWAARHGHEVVAWFADEGVSGTNGIEDREALGEALIALNDGQAEGLIVADLLRLARELTIQEVILAKVWGYDGAMFTVNQGEILKDDPDDPMRTAMRQMAGVFAQLERGMTVLRLRTGKRNKAARGGYIGGGVPFGKAVKDGEFTDDPAELATIAALRELADQGLSLRGIADTLNTEGIRPKRGGQWYASTVSRVLAA